MKKRSFNKKSLIFTVPAVLLIGVLCYALISALCIYIPQEKEQKSFTQLKESIRVDTADNTSHDASDGKNNNDDDGTGIIEPKVQAYDFDSLGKMNPDYVGWLTIEDTLIDYPVMKSSEDDPEYYLHRDFDGNNSFSGCLFIGEGCSSESKAFVIYGHNMNNETMFGALDEYYDYNYAINHKDIRFFTHGEERVYRVFAAFQTKVYSDREDVFKYYEAVGDLDEAEYNDAVENIRRMSQPSLPDAPQYPAQLMFLSTCSYHTDDGRFVVAAYRIQ